MNLALHFYLKGGSILILNNQNEIVYKYMLQIQLFNIFSILNIIIHFFLSFFPNLAPNMNFQSWNFSCHKQMTILVYFVLGIVKKSEKSGFRAKNTTFYWIWHQICHLQRGVTLWVFNSLSWNFAGTCLKDRYLYPSLDVIYIYL